VSAAVEEKRRWFKPPKMQDNGTMELVDHLRELRYRLVVSVAALVVVSIGCLVFVDQLYNIMTKPITDAIATYQASYPGARVELTTEGVTGAFSLFFKVGFMAGFVLSCPVWIYQLWSFVAPGLLSKEKKVVYSFMGAAIPLFLLGVAAGYWISPKGFAAMLSFNPPNVVNLNEMNNFLSFEMRLLLVFGLAFLLPVVLVSLNRIGIVTGAQLGKFRNMAILLCTAFAAVATPSVDAFTMLVLDVPMIAMYLISEVLCRIHDRQNKKS